MLGFSDLIFVERMELIICIKVSATFSTESGLRPCEREQEIL